MTLPASRTLQLLTADQVAAQLGVTRRFVRRLVAERRITFHRVGRFIRFDPADVDACVAAGRVEPIHARPVRSS